MRELRTYGSGRGALSNGRPYRDRVQDFQIVRECVHREIKENQTATNASRLT